MLMYSRDHHKTVKQLSSNKKKINAKKNALQMIFQDSYQLFWKTRDFRVCILYMQVISPSREWKLVAEEGRG